MGDDSTIIFTDIKGALDASEEDAKDKNAALIAVGGELNGTIFDLPEGSMTFGRSEENTFALEFQGVSRQHLKLTIKDKTVILEDLESRNGTYLNNQKVESATQLRKGDIIKLGTVALKYIPKGDPERVTYDRLHQEANTDGLTKCYNKTYFNKNCDIEVKKSKVTGKPLSLVLFDLDHFKKLNDNYGHDAGDFVLKDVAEIIRNNGIRENDIFARYGGEEFVIILPNTNLKKCFEIAERIRKLIADHKFVYDQKVLPVSISIGVSDYRPGVNTGSDLFKRADTALYISKNGGRNRVSFFKE